jgi:hypothetical protein
MSSEVEAAIERMIDAKLEGAIAEALAGLSVAKIVLRLRILPLAS